MEKKGIQKVQIYVKEDTFIIVNGNKEEIKKGIHEMEEGKAQILIDAKVAEKIEKEK